jgi:hypothetical protein
MRARGRSWIIWAFFWYRCGKLLAPLMREQMACFEAWPSFRITAEVKAKLLVISPATIDRVLKEDRKKLAPKGICGTKPGKLLKKHIPVRTHYPWNERKPGFFAHCFIKTLPKLQRIASCQIRT